MFTDTMCGKEKQISLPRVTKAHYVLLFLTLFKTLTNNIEISIANKKIKL